MWVSGVWLPRVTLSLCNTVMNHSPVLPVLLTFLWKSSKYPELLWQLFFPRAVALQQICFFTLCFYSPLTNFLILHDGSRASLKWEFALFCCPGESKDFWDQESRNQSSLGLLTFFFQFVFWVWTFNCKQLSSEWQRFAFKLITSLTLAVVVQENLVCRAVLLVSPSSSLPMGWQDEFPESL